MDIKYKDKDVEISIKNVNNAMLTSDELERVTKIIEVFKGFKEPIEKVIPLTVKKAFNEQETIEKTMPLVVKKALNEQEIIAKEERPVVRDRIPNQVDLSELEIKKAVTQEPMIRCPNCGQSSKVIVCISYTENYLLRKVTKNNKKTFETVMLLEDEDEINNILKPKNATAIDYHNDIMKIKQSKKLKDTDLNVSNETKLQCPCCHSVNKFSKWIDAFKDPLSFGFETEMLCPICGSEAVKAIDENKNEILKCECCGYSEFIV